MDCYVISSLWFTIAGSLNTEPTVFTGYETLNDTGVVVALSDEETLTDAIATDEQAKEDVLVVLDKTPFYAEMGGQAADHGVITGAECSLRVLDVKKTPKGYYVHTCVLESGIVKVGDHGEPTKEELKAIHTLIKKVTGDIETFSYNTSISAFMICVKRTYFIEMSQ